MIAAFRWWSMVVSPMRGAMSSSSASGGSWYSGRGFAGARPSVRSPAAPLPPSAEPRAVLRLWRTNAAGRAPGRRSANRASRRGTEPESRRSHRAANRRERNPIGAGGAKVADDGPWLGIAAGTDLRRRRRRVPAWTSRPDFCSREQTGRTESRPRRAGALGGGCRRCRPAQRFDRTGGQVRRAERRPPAAIMSMASRKPAIMITVSNRAVPGAVIRGGNAELAMSLPMIPPCSDAPIRPGRAPQRNRAIGCPPRVSSQSPRTLLARSHQLPAQMTGARTAGASGRTRTRARSSRAT